MPSVSVIIPCYNHAHYLPYALRSVLAQTFADWEAIIVDDGSTDNTPEVAAQFIDLRIRYIYQENRGLSAARNSGIQAAQGAYLAFLDADDEWEIDFLARCIEALASSPDLVGVYTLCSYSDSTGQHLPKVGGHCTAGSEFRTHNLEGGFFPVHAALVRARVVREVGQFDESLTSEEDWDLWFRVSERGRMLCVPLPLARYRVYPGSMSTNAARMHANAVAVLTKYLGPPEGNPAFWHPDKRRGYAFAYRAAAFGYIAQQETDEGWRYLQQAVETEPGLLQRLDTFYELALGDQPRGYRGEATQVDIAANGAEMLRRLDILFASAITPVQSLKGEAYGNTYLALAMLSDQAGCWQEARGYLLRAIKHNPRLVSPSVVRRLLKLYLGSTAVRRIKSLTRASSNQDPQRV